MMTSLIDVLVGSIVIPIFILSILIGIFSFFLILRNIGARIAVVRAVVSTPSLLGSILSVEDVASFLVNATRSGDTKVPDEDIEALLRFVLLQQSHRLTNEHVAAEGALINRKSIEVDYRLYSNGVEALRSLMEERRLFNNAVSHIVEAVIRNNSEDLVVSGWFSKLTSLNWITSKLGGSNKGAVGYFVRFLFRDAILNLIERISEMGCIFVGEHKA